ncbi:MAG: pseudaminic acid biosynthesis-associated methylase [Verrucomicrobia bacterium]|nr:pseudaminic acid biosynthesis-associated methylase [Verrucomicrobiota bacterium]
MTELSPQEEFWRGAFGSEYSDRNVGANLAASNTALFSRALARACAPRTVLELGANIGMNLVALGHLFPDAELHAVEINAKACDRLRELLPPDRVTEGSILVADPGDGFDLVLIKGVLIHIAPEDLATAYRRAVASSRRYLLICEYYNSTPVEVTYRGESQRLFKRDFCGEILDKHPEMQLIDYGFVYHRDPVFPLDDITWFLLERREV